jgi:hypothetical protein
MLIQIALKAIFDKIGQLISALGIKAGMNGLLSVKMVSPSLGWTSIE